MSYLSVSSFYAHYCISTFASEYILSKKKTDTFRLENQSNLNMSFYMTILTGEFC